MLTFRIYDIICRLFVMKRALNAFVAQFAILVCCENIYEPILPQIIPNWMHILTVIWINQRWCSFQGNSRIRRFESAIMLRNQCYALNEIQNAFDGWFETGDIISLRNSSGAGDGIQWAYSENLRSAYKTLRNSFFQTSIISDVIIITQYISHLISINLMKYWWR